MATGGNPTDLERQEADMRYTCSLCMEPYWGRTPKLLPACHHTFCVICLMALEQSVRSAMQDAATADQQKEEPTQVKSEEGQDEDQPSEGKSPGDDLTKGSCGDVTANQDDVSQASFPCPTCRTPVLIPEGGVREFQTNFYVDHETTPEGSSSSSSQAAPPVPCDMCEDSNPQQQPAAHRCLECGHNMCRSCRRYHDMCTQNHHVTPLGSTQPSEAKGEKPSVCLLHQGQVLSMHCGQCQVAICMHCKVTAHEGHPTLDLATAALKAWQELRALMPSAQQQVEEVDRWLQETEGRQWKVENQGQQLREQIQAQLQLVTTWAQRSHDQLVEQVRAHQTRTLGQLQAEKDRHSLTRRTLWSLLTQASHASSSDPQVISCTRELKEAMLSQEQLVQLQQQPADCQGLRYDISEGSPFLREEDVRACLGQVVEVGDDADDAGTAGNAEARPVSLRELAARLERLDKEMTENTHILATQVNSCTDDVTAIQQKVEQKTDQLEKDMKQKTDQIQQKTDQMKKEMKKEMEQKTDHMKKEMKQKTDQLEKKTDQMKKDMEQKTDQLVKKGDQLEKKGDQLQKEMEKKTAALQKGTDELQRKTTSLTTDIASCKTTGTQLQKVTQTLKESMGKAKVMFKAHSLDTDKIKEDANMIFREVATNEGGCYDQTTGVFTVPLSGLYYITATVENAKRDVTANGRIRVDDVTQCCIAGGYDGNSGSVVVALTQGQKVGVKAWNSVDKYGGDAYYSNFSGVLLLPSL